MKRFPLLVMTLTISFFAFAQEKTLSLSDAILKQRSTLGPTSKIDLKFRPQTGEYLSLSKDYKSVIAGAVQGNSSEKVLVTLEEINEALEQKVLRHLYGLTWLDSSTVQGKAGNLLFHYNVSSNEITHKVILEEGQLPLDANANGDLIFGVEHNIGLASHESARMVTKNEDAEIVSGQAIARSEFGIVKGTFWSPTNTAFAFYQKDESEVADYPLLDINPTPGALKSIKYPMAGQGSEKATVGVYHLKKKKTVYLDSPIEEKDHYFTNVGWSPDGKYITVAELNRGQNHMWFNVYEAKSGKFVKTLFEEKNERYVEPEHPAYFISDDEFIWLSERDGQTQPFQYSLSQGFLRKAATNNWEITDIIGTSGESLLVMGTGNNPTEMHAFAINQLSGEIQKITQEAGYHRVSFDAETKTLLDHYSSVDVPGVDQVINLNGEVLKTLHKSEDPLSDYQVAKPELFTITSADGKTPLHGRMIKPFDFDSTKTYPVLVYVYGGPHAQMVTNRWIGGAPLWMYFQANKGYIVCTIDNRGSAHRSFEFESIIHRNLGEAEMLDQLEGVKYLKSQPYVDGERMAVHGWSYGGFMTTSLMLRHPGVFKAGVAGGPVTDWAYYEAMYGERYMDTPEENPEGYAANRLMNHVENLEGDLLLIHGTIDNVVVMQHNLALVKAFIDKGIQIDFFPYPMHEHNVRGKDRVHLMTKVLDYIDDKLEVE